MLHLPSVQIWPACNKGITQFYMYMYLPPTHEPYLPLLHSCKASPPSIIDLHKGSISVFSVLLFTFIVTTGIIVHL